MFCIRLHAGFSILTTLTERTWLMNHSGTRMVSEPLSVRFGMPIRRITRILFSLCSDLETDVIGESVQRGFDADIKLIERRQLLLW